MIEQKLDDVPRYKSDSTARRSLGKLERRCAVQEYGRGKSDTVHVYLSVATSHRPLV